MDVTQLAEERPFAGEDAQLKAILEAIVYVTDEPLSAQQMAAALGHPIDKIRRLLDELVADYARPERGLSVREVAGGYKMATKALDSERYAAPAIVERNMHEGRIGLTTRAGFLDYDNLDIEAYRRDRLKAFVAMLGQLGLARPPVLGD